MKNIFLDRDGIINEVVMRGDTIGSPRSLDEFTFRKDFLLFFELIKNKKINLFVVSNQPDIARKKMGQQVLEDINTLLKSYVFKEIVYCTHDNDNSCSCRKPKPGMIEYLLDKYNLNKEESCIIGDSHKDILAGKAAEITTILLKTVYNKNQECNPDFEITKLNSTELSKIISFKNRSN